MNKKKKKPLRPRENIYHHGLEIIYHFLCLLDALADSVEAKGGQDENKRYPES